MQRWDIMQHITSLFLLYGTLTIAYVNEDDTFGDEDMLLTLLGAVQGLIAVAIAKLLQRRQLPRELLYAGHRTPNLANLALQCNCKELFRFEVADLIIILDALGWAGQTFRIPTGREGSNNWYIATGETVLLMLLYRLASPGRVAAMTLLFGCGTSKISACINWGLDWIYANIIPRVNNIDNWRGEFAVCADHLFKEMDCPHDKIIGFVDGTLVCTATPLRQGALYHIID